MTAVDLGPWAAAVPDAVVASIVTAHRVLIVSHENPDADTLGAALGVATLVEAHGGPRRRSAPTPCRPSTTSCPDRTGQDRSRSRRRLRPARGGRLRLARPGRGDPPPPRGAVRRAAPGRHRPPPFQRGRDGDRLDRSGRGRDLRDGRPARGASRRALDADDGGLATVLTAGIVMDTATFAHPNATPRTLAVAAALVEAGAPLSEISRRLYRSKPDVQLRLFGRVLDRLAHTDDGRVIWSTLTDADLVETGTSAPTPRASSISWRRPSAPRWRSCSRRSARRPGSASGRSRAGSTRRS